MRSPRLLFLWLLAFTLLLPSYDAPARAAAQQTTVTLWTGQAKLTHEHRGTESDVTVTWSRTAELDFSFDSRRKVDPQKRYVYHWLKGEWRTKAGLAFSMRHGKTNLDERQIDRAVIEMSVKTCAPELSAPVAGLGDNALRLSVAARPAVVYRFAGAGESRGELALIMRGEFPYDYRDPQFDPPEVDVPQMQASGAHPLPGVGAILNPPNTPAKMKVTMKRKPLKLEYTPQKTDMAGATPSGKTYRAVTPFYATDPRGGWLIHGNSRIHVMVDGKDASAGFEITRFIADSVQAIDGNGRRDGQLHFAPWRVDTDTVGGLWIDIPGQHLATPPAKWPSQRYMQEYLVGVKEFPEFGALYFIVVIDTKPNAFRVRMYRAQTITIAQWCTIKARRSPYRNEASSGNTEVDSGWQPAR